jgi:hypothetical protein
VKGCKGPDVFDDPRPWTPRGHSCLLRFLEHHPVHSGSCGFLRLRFGLFHGGKTGSNPVGNASLEPTTSSHSLENSCTRRHKFPWQFTFLFSMASPLSSLRAGKELCEDHSLSPSPQRPNSLSVGIECHARGRVSKQLLHYLLCPLHLPSATWNTNVEKACQPIRLVMPTLTTPGQMNDTRVALSPEWELPQADRPGENLLT